jgi:hypothetical protein
MVGQRPKHTQAVWLAAAYDASPNPTAQRIVFTKTAEAQLSAGCRSISPNDPGMARQAELET